MFTTTTRQQEKINFVLNQMLTPESNGDNWMWKSTLFVPDHTTDECSEVRLIFFDKSDISLYYIISNDDSHIYYYTQRGWKL